MPGSAVTLEEQHKICLFNKATTNIKITLAATGTPIGNNDAAIAGHAIAAGAVLVTNNTSKFERVPGLIIEDWVL